jgi:hypothetical protein
VGESCTLPESCEPLTSVRLDEPAIAVIVTDVALDACQFSVTLWPGLSEFVLAERVMAGATFGSEFPHDAETNIAPIRIPQEIERNASFIIGSLIRIRGRKARNSDA